MLCFRVRPVTQLALMCVAARGLHRSAINLLITTLCPFQKRGMALEILKVPERYLRIPTRKGSMYAYNKHVTIHKIYI